MGLIDYILLSILGICIVLVIIYLLKIKINVAAAVHLAHYQISVIRKK